MKDKISENGMVYKVVGDYYVTMLFNDLVLTGWLWTYLANLNEQSQNRLKLIIRPMQKVENVTNELKEKDQMAWVQAMNSIRNRAEEIAVLIPKGIVCVESALFHYGYCDFAPRKWSIAVPRTMTRTKLDIDGLALQPYYVQSEIYEIGKITDDFSRIRLPVYDRERTICDCFKYRSRLDNEVFNKALNAYAKDEKKNLKNLSIYAKKLRVYKKVNELMPVLLDV